MANTSRGRLIMPWKRVSVALEVGRRIVRVGGPCLWDSQLSLMEPKRYGLGVFIEKWWVE
jgi:hypothetical protein